MAQESNSNDLVEKILNQVHVEGKARKTLKKLLAQDKVFTFLQEQSKKTGESIETVAYKFAIEAKGSLEDRQIEKDNGEEISKKTKEAHDRLKKALNGEGGAEILQKTSEHFGGDRVKARESLIKQTIKVARKEAIKAIKSRRNTLEKPLDPVELTETIDPVEPKPTEAEAKPEAETEPEAEAEEAEAEAEAEAEIEAPTETEFVPPAIPVISETQSDETESESKTKTSLFREKYTGAYWIPSIPAGDEFPRPDPRLYWSWGS